MKPGFDPAPKPPWSQPALEVADAAERCAALFDAFLRRLSHATEAERLASDALFIVRAAAGIGRATVWCWNDQLAGFGRIAALGYADERALPVTLPPSLSRLFPPHLNLESPAGADLAPLEVPIFEGAASEPFGATRLITLPGPHVVQGVLLLGPSDPSLRAPLDEEALGLQLDRLASELGRALAAIGRNHGLADGAEGRIQASMQFSGRLEEELARAERFKRELSVLCIAVDPPPGLVREGEQSLVALAESVARWLASKLRMMDSIGLRPDRSLVAALPETSRGGAELLKARLFDLATAESFGLSVTHRPRLRLRIGVAAYPNDGVSTRFLVLAAEHASREAAVVGEPGAQASSEAALGDRISVDTPLIGRHPVAASARMREVLELSRRVAPSRLTVLLQGETGVGKERIAEFIHNHSERHQKPAIRVNCGAIPESMIEAEFFGFERGSFTGAVRSTRGKFELADGSTLFLDEIGELSLTMQVKLLRVLDEQRFYRLGAALPTQVDVRVIAITNRDLAQDVASGRFREDLYYRLNVVTIKIPSLRDRPEDIPPLVDRLITEFCERSHTGLKKVALEAYDLLYSHPWRGNVRELRNVIERSMVVSTGSYITADDLVHAMPDLAFARKRTPTSVRRVDPGPRVPPAAPAPVAASQATAMHRGEPGAGRQEGILELIRRNPDIALQDILRELGASKSTAIRVVNELIARGQVIRCERGKRSRYRAAEATNS